MNANELITFSDECKIADLTDKDENYHADYLVPSFEGSRALKMIGLFFWK